MSNKCYLKSNENWPFSKAWAMRDRPSNCIWIMTPGFIKSKSNFPTWGSHRTIKSPTERIVLSGRSRGGYFGWKKKKRLKEEKPARQVNSSHAPSLAQSLDLPLVLGIKNTSCLQPPPYRINIDRCIKCGASCLVETFCSIFGICSSSYT